jgi:hypothetical protein
MFFPCLGHNLRMANLYFVLLGLVFLHASAAASYNCTDLPSFTSLLEVDSLAITTATVVAANSTAGLPSYCNVTGEIGGRIGVWFMLPSAQTWNKRYVQYGCGGACGYNPFTTDTSVDSAIAAGYAVGTTDMGNNASTWTLFYDNFQARADWGYLATHLTAVAGKNLVSAYYDQSPVFSYHSGGSTGGRQGLMEAQRYPGDFDGIVAVAPAYDETGITLQSIAWNGQATVKNDSVLTPILTEQHSVLIHQAALAACDLDDGVADGVIPDPRACHFDIDSLACGSSSPNSTDCLTIEAIEAAKKLYQGPVNSAGERLLPENMLPGSEYSWPGSYISTTPGAIAYFTEFGGEYASNYAFWPSPIDAIGPMDISMDLSASQTMYMENQHYAGSADLRMFHTLGSKMLIFQGLGDPAVAPSFALDYYQRVVVALGGRNVTDEFILFYEMPGVAHVSGGPGADTYDALASVAAWVEEGVKPYNITASHSSSNGTVEFTRPLYPYPELAHYRGCGDKNLSSNWIPKTSSTGQWWSL